MIMYRQLIISSVLINFISAGEQNVQKYDSNNNKAIINAEQKNTGAIKTSTEYNLWHQHFWKPHKGTSHNITYIDRADNLIRLPAITKHYEENKKKKAMKKPPKRTIQKIIKKNRSKIKKSYIIKMTSYPTVIPNLEFENAQEDLSHGKEETTTQSNQKKKQRKYNAKLPRYPMPFHQMQTRRNNHNIKRDRRDTRDIFILKDFDEMQFLKENKDYNVVNAHFKTYW